MHSAHERDMRVLVDTIVDVVVILVFITLGANLPWGDIRGNLCAGARASSRRLHPRSRAR